MVDQIGQSIEYARQMIEQRQVTCSVCRKRRAIDVWVVVTDDPMQGAPEDGSRMLALGICAGCKQTKTEEELDAVAREVLFFNEPPKKSKGLM